MRIALYANERDNQPRSADVPWEALCRALTEHTRTQCDPCPGHKCGMKYGRAWSPAEYEDGATRGNENVKAIHALVLDLDSPSPDSLRVFAEAAQGRQFIVHSTHTPGNFRAVFTLSRPVLRSEWGNFWVRSIALLRAPADRARRDLAGLFFFPTCSYWAEAKSFKGEGAPLDVDAVLRIEIPNGIPPAIDVGAVHAAGDAHVGHIDSPAVAGLPGGLPSVSGLPVDLDPIRQALRRQRRPESSALAKKILAGEPLSEPHAGDYGGRNGALNAAASLLATAPDVLQPLEAAMAFLEPCIRKMNCQPEGVDYWLKIASDQFTRAAKRRADNDDRAARAHREILEAVGMDPTKPTATEDWRKGLLWRSDKDGDIKGLEQWPANADLIFQNDARWKGTVRFNEVTKTLDVAGGPLLGLGPSVLDTEAGNWLQRSEYRLFLPRHVVGDQLLAIGRRNSYDPLAEYLRGVRPKWDGKARADYFLERYFGAQGPTEHVRRISARWLISAVARALRPGCKVDTVLILEGGQGKKKSTAIQTLTGNPAWFSDTKLDLGSKDSRMVAANKWIIEIQELASFRKSDAESLKAFFSQRHDDLRPPYGRVVEMFARRCVFVGTTNLDEYLSDETGHRRFWPVRISGDVDVSAIETDRDQIWAEAVARFEAGEKWWLDGADAELAEQLAAEHATTSSRTEVIWRWWTNIDPAKRPETVTTQDIGVEALHMPIERLTNAIRQEIGHAMKELGFTKRRERKGDALLWVFRASEALRTAQYKTVTQDPSASIELAQATQPGAKA